MISIIDNMIEKTLYQPNWWRNIIPSIIIQCTVALFYLPSAKFLCLKITFLYSSFIVKILIFHLNLITWSNPVKPKEFFRNCWSCTCTIQVHIPVNFIRKLLLVISNYISVVILIELSIFDLLNPYKVTQCVYFPK